MKGRKIYLKNDKVIKIEQKNTYGIGDYFMISAVRVGKTTFIVSSYFTNNREFPDVMDKVIESKVKTF